MPEITERACQRAAYEHIRISLTSSLARELMEASLDEELSQIIPEHLKTIENIESDEEPNEPPERDDVAEEQIDESDLDTEETMSSMFSTNMTGDIAKDVGNIVSTEEIKAETELLSRKQRILYDLYESFGSN